MSGESRVASPPRFIQKIKTWLKTLNTHSRNNPLLFLLSASILHSVPFLHFLPFLYFSRIFLRKTRLGKKKRGVGCLQFQSKVRVAVLSQTRGSRGAKAWALEMTFTLNYSVFKFKSLRALEEKPASRHSRRSATSLAFPKS